MCALKRSLLAPTPFVSALGELLSRLYDRGRRRDRESRGVEGPQSNKTKNGPPFTMPHIYIISRNLRHFRSSRFVPLFLRHALPQPPSPSWRGETGAKLIYEGQSFFLDALSCSRAPPNLPRSAPFIPAENPRARGRLIGPMRYADECASRLAVAVNYR